MKNRFGWRSSLVTITVLLNLCARASTSDDEPDALLAAMHSELLRAQTSLGKLDPAPYFMSYSVYDQSISLAAGTQGSLVTSTHVRHRTADITMRIGAPALDNSHEKQRTSAKTTGTLPLEDDRDAIAHELWRLTYEEYRKASKAYASVKTNSQVQAKEEDPSPTFPRRSRQRTLITPRLRLHPIKQRWRSSCGIIRLRSASTHIFTRHS